MRTVPAGSALLLALLAATPGALAAEAVAPRVVLEHVGEAPKAPLRLQPRAGASALFEVQVEQDLTGRRGEGLLELTAWFQSDVQRVEPDGSAEVLTWLAGISLSRPNLKGLDQALAHTLGLEVRGRMDARGLTSRATLGLRGQPIAHPPVQLRALLTEFTQHAVPLPEDAVGVGAKWRVEDTLEMMGARVGRRVTYQLAARTADSVELDVSYSLHAEDVELATALGRFARLKRLKGEGSSRMRLQLVGAPGGELDVTLRLSLEPADEDRRPEALTVRTRVERAKELHPFMRWKDGVPEPLRCPEGTAPDEVWHEGPEPKAIAFRCARPDGTPHGPVVAVALTGVHAFQGEYRDGLRFGTWRAWNRAGSEEPFVSTWREGRLDGLNEIPDPREGLLEKGEWRDGLREGPFEVHSPLSGGIGRGTYVRGEKEGTWTWQHPEVRFEVEYRGGKRHGREVVRDASGKETRRGTWREDLKDGEWVSVGRDGRVERSVYRMGKLWTGTRSRRDDPAEGDGGFEEGTLREGKRQGVWTEWAGRHGSQPTAMGRYVDGRREGRWRTWHRESRGRPVLASEGAWRRGVREGRWTWFDEEGRRVRVETWRGGKLDGPFTRFHASGRKLEEGRYRKGLQDGAWQRWDEDGELQWKGRFAAGKPVGTWTVRQGRAGLKPVSVKRGAPCPPWTALLIAPTREQPLAGCREWETGALEGHFSLMHEVYGYVAEEGSLARSLKDGAWTLYYPSGNVLARGAYRAGLKDGPWTYFHDAKDRVLVEAAYTAGRRSGLWRAFDAEGRPWMELRHVPGEVEPRAFLAPTGPEGLENMASTPPHSVVTGPGSFPGAWLLPHGTPEREVTQETFIRVFHPNGKVQSEGTWKGRRPVGVHRTWSEDGHEVEVVDRDAGTRRAAAGPGKAREERTREVDAKSFLTRRWDERGRLVWLARTGEDDALQGRVTVWDGNGQPRAYLNGARGILQGAFRLPGSEGQPDLTGRALYGEVIEIQPDPCPPGSRLDIRLREELRLDCELPDGPAVLRGEWSADLTPSGWVKDPNGHQAEDAKRAAGARGSRQGESDEVSRYPDGRPRWEKVTEADGHQRYRAWYPDGTLREEGRYREGAPDGLWRGFAPNGTPVWEGRFDGGNRVGVWQAWYEDGTRRSRHGFGAWRFARFWRRDGSLWKEAEESPREQLDLWRWYSPGGKLQVEGTMRKGAPIGPWRLDLDGDGVFESRELPDGKRLQWRVSGADGQSTLEVVTQGEGATGTWRLTDAQGPRDVSLRREGEVQKRWTRDAKGVLVAVPQRAPEPEEHASEPPPWKARVDDEAPPFLPEELAAEAATP